MRRIASLILVGAFIVAGCGSSNGTAAPGTPGPSNAGASTSQAAQTDGTTSAGCGTGTYKGFKTTTYCGTAKGTVTIAGTAYQVTGGQCLYDDAVGFAANIGTSVTGSTDVAPGGPQYIFVSAFPSAGASVSGIVNGVWFSISDESVTDTVTIAPDHKSGTASGVAGSSDDPVTVSFTC